MSTVAWIPPARSVFYNSSGSPLAGGFVYTYVPGGTTPKATWQNSAGTTLNANPIVLDSSGSCLLYGDGSYQLTVTDSRGNNIPGYSGITYVSQISAQVSNIAALRLNSAPVSNPYSIYVAGYSAPADGGQGVFIYVPTDTTTADNGGTVIVDAIGQRWHRDIEGPDVYVGWFGADMTGATDSTAAFQAALNYAAALNGSVLLPTGTLQISSVTVNAQYKNLASRGAGKGATNISTTSTTANVLTLTVNYLDIFDLAITASVNRTAGAHLASTANVSTLSNVVFDKFYIGLAGTDNEGMWTNLFFTNPMLNAVGMTLGSATFLGSYQVGLLITNVMFYSGSYQPSAGIIVKSVGGMLLTNCLINTYGLNLWVCPGNNQGVYSMQVFGGAFDAGTHGLAVDPTGTGVVARCKFIGTEFNSNTSDGVTIQNSGTVLCNGFEFTECMFSQNGGSGLGIVAGAVAGVTVIGGNMGQNTGAGILIGAGIKDFTITGVQAGAYAGWQGNGNYGITVQSGASDRYIISQNRTTGNTSGGVSDGGSGSNKSVTANIT